MFNGGWAGKILRVDLTKQKIADQELSKDLAYNYIGGRGFAAKILWDELEPGTNPLSPDNLLIIASGPLSGTPTPSSGKIVVAAKSPLTGGYGDGNLGAEATQYLKGNGYDAMVVKGKAEKPTLIHITENGVELKDASAYWGMNALDAIDAFRRDFGKDAAVLTIGPGGERLVKYAIVVGERTRTGGRPGIGAVFGSKNLKAIVIDKNVRVPMHDPDETRKIGTEAAVYLRKLEMYQTWVNQGTMIAIEWSQENSVLPTFNFSEGLFDEHENISGDTMYEKYKFKMTGCPWCIMPCGNMSRAHAEPFKGIEVELDYENVGMLGSNLGIGSLDAVIMLNYIADQGGVDTISMGSAIGFAMELYEKGKLPDKYKDGLKLNFGNVDAAVELANRIVKREGELGKLLSEGVKKASEVIGNGADLYAIHVKGLEVSAYDCHAAPGMALAYGTSPIGAHHKDAWYIAQEVKKDRLAYDRWKAEGVIELQRIRGGMFEYFVGCRLPWVELGLPLDYYLKLFKAVTGLDYTMEKFYEVADRIYALIRAFWIREFGHWKREYDYPPKKWFEIPLTKGPYAGVKLDRAKYGELLNHYYDLRGWDENGVPKKSTLRKLGLDFVIPVLEKIVPLHE
ncbi:MAG: aldehyde ferredoxin oxidoreductase family protein [Candidatus Njordarchaeia archaeon]